MDKGGGSDSRSVCTRGQCTKNFGGGLSGRVKKNAWMDGCMYICAYVGMFLCMYMYVFAYIIGVFKNVNICTFLFKKIRFGSLQN